MDCAGAGIAPKLGESRASRAGVLLAYKFNEPDEAGYWTLTNRILELADYPMFSGTSAQRQSRKGMTMIFAAVLERLIFSKQVSLVNLSYFIGKFLGVNSGR